MASDTCKEIIGFENHSFVYPNEIFGSDKTFPVDTQTIS